MPRLQQTFARLATLNGNLSLKDANQSLRENSVKLVPLHVGQSDFSEEFSTQQKVALSYVLSLLDQGDPDGARDFIQYWYDGDIDSIEQQFDDLPPEIFSTIYQRD